MAYPQITSTSTSFEDINTTSHDVTMPLTVVVDNWLLVIINCADAVTMATPAGWTKILDQSSGGGSQTSVFIKKAVGDEGGTTVNFTSSGATQTAHVVYAGDTWFNDLTGIEITDPAATGTGNNSPDPGSLNPSWGAQDTLFIAFAAPKRGDNTVTAYPTSYISNQIEANAGGSNGATAAMATRELNAASEDPSAYTISRSDTAWLAGTIAIRPASAGGPSITNITDPITTSGVATITGTGFGATQGASSVTQNGVTLTVNSWSDTSIEVQTVNIESSSLKYGNHTFQVTIDGGGSDTITADVNPESGNSFVDLVAPLATSGDRITAIADLAGNDQLRYESFLQQGVVTTSYPVTVNIDGTFSIGGGPVPDGTYEFEVRAWDTSDQTWGTVADQTVVINSSGFAISSTPADIRVTESRQISVTGAQTGLVVTDFDIRFDNASGVQATITNLVDNGGGSYDITFYFPLVTTKLFDGTGYPIYVDANGDNTTSGNVPYLPKTGYNYVTISSPDPTTEVAKQYTGLTPATGDQWVWFTTTDPSLVTATYDAQLFLELSTTVPSKQQLNGYLIKSDGTVGRVHTISVILEVLSSLNVTLDDVTSVASSTVTTTGSSAPTLDDVLSASTGTITTSGTLSKTFDDVVSSISGTVTTSGTLNSTLDDVIMLSGTFNIGTLNATLDDVTSTSSGDVSVIGSLNETLEDVVSLASAQITNVGSLVSLLEATFSTASGTVTATGTLNSTLDDVTMFTGALVIGTSNVVLENVTITTTGNVSNKGTATITLDDVTMLGVSSVSNSGSITVDLEDVYATMNGSVTTSGSLNVDLDDVEMGTTSFPELFTTIRYVVYLLDSTRIL